MCTRVAYVQRSGQHGERIFEKEERQEQKRGAGPPESTLVCRRRCKRTPRLPCLQLALASASGQQSCTCALAAGLEVVVRLCLG